MKTLFALLVLIIFSFTFQNNHFNKISNQFFIEEKKLNLQCPAPLSFEQRIKSIGTKDDKKIDQNWYQEAIENIRQLEYNITYSDELGAYQSSNRENNMRFIYHKDGFTAKLRDNRVPLFDVNDKSLGEKDKKYKYLDEWSIDFTLQCVNHLTNTPLCSPLLQRGDGGVLFNESEFVAAENKAYIENENIRIEYRNDKEGMRQDFIIKKKPEGEGKLRINLSAGTKLKMFVGADALMFKDKMGNDKMKYSSLKCWDANGKELRAYFEKNELQITNDKLQIESKSKVQNPKSKIETNPKSEIPNSKFSIVVNDEEAVYPVTIDPLSNTPDWTGFIPTLPYDFGWSVSTAGDVNGDGYSDVIVEQGNESGFIDTIRVFVFHGNASGLPVTPDWTVGFFSRAVYGFGNFVSTAGDVNGDGYSDVIIGGFFNIIDPNSLTSCVYHGSSSGLSLTANWTVRAGFWENSVSTAGDVNGDGFSDVIIGAPYNQNGESDEGRAFVYLGSANGLSANANWTAESNQNGAFFGSSVSTAGDVNRDGFSDVIIGADGYDNGESNEGRSFVYLGSANGLSATANWTAEGNQAGAYFGNSVSTAGDVNGDGYSDVVVGAYQYDNGESDEGRAFVYYGSASGLLATANWTAEGNQAGAYFGISVSTAGDVNGDGYADVIVGANWLDNPELNEGRTYVYNGSASGLTAIADWTAESNQNGAFFGSSVSTAGDVNGDGYSDVIVGAYRYPNSGPSNGRVYVYHGSASGLSAATNWTSECNQNDAYLGWSVSTAGDVNGDGYSDIIVGAYLYDNGQSNEGRAFVFHGSASGLSTTASWTAESNQATAYFGVSVSTAGDVNNDGYADVIVGATGYDKGQTDEGVAFVYLGSSSGLSPVAQWTAESDQNFALFGNSVSTAGDVNGDGFSDVIIGAYRFDNTQTDEGKVYVYYGSPSGLLLTANWTAENNQSSANFGNSVSTAGDVNGDGFSDVIIGALNYSNGQTFEGSAFVFHGSASGLSTTANWTGESNQEYASLGNSVSTAGDINGDGYADVIVGAKDFDNIQTDRGRAFAYHGSASGLSATANWIGEINQNYAYYGNSVSTAGDVNGDGYSDVIIGAFSFDNGQTNEGRAFVYHGSASGLSVVANWTAESDQGSAYFGISVSTAGDVNGDGYSDVIVGAYGYDNGESNEGKAFVYYGNNGGGLISSIGQYKHGSLRRVYSGGLTGTDGGVRFSIWGKSPYGRADGKIVYEYKKNGFPFSGPVITNSVGSSGSGVSNDLGIQLTALIEDVSGLLTNMEYKWRARVQYSLVNNPYQKFGPWKYYTNYVPVPFGCFKPKVIPPVTVQLGLRVLIQGFYDASTNLMVQDFVKVYIRNYFFPYELIDSTKLLLGTDGFQTVTMDSVAIVDNALYYLQIFHRNSLETWSVGSGFTNSAQTYDFSTAAFQAFGSNQIQVDSSPLKFAIYSGDVNQDGIIDASDLSGVENDATVSLSGYVSTDLTGDDYVDAQDISIVENNIGVSMITP